jgi:hypothetical protein
MADYHEKKSNLTARLAQLQADKERIVKKAAATLKAIADCDRMDEKQKADAEATE